MASLVLSVAAGAAGSAVFGPAGALVGRVAGALAGSAIDRSLFASGGARERSVQGPRLANLEVMASTEGAAIPRVYGRARLSGQVIWATKLQEVVTTSSQTSGGGSSGGKGMGGGSAGAVTTTTTSYSYFANFAVGLAQGAIGNVMRVWADGKPLDLSTVTMRVYRGDETQAADPLIVAKQGDTPAYRGLAYAVFERLPLANFGNRIPQLSFEVLRPVGELENMVRAVTLIPGSTEFGYEPGTVVRALGPGISAPENRHVSFALSDVIASLDELQAACPNLERVAIVVAWFGTDLRCGDCEIVPGVDNTAKSTYGATWSVAGETRGSARLLTQIEGRAAFGGTPSDDSVKNLIAELKARGLKVTLYPFVLMDVPPGNALSDPWSDADSQPVFPWRGRITCDPAPGRPGTVDGTADAAAQVEAFFGDGSAGYRRMILHYANLAFDAGGVDAFIIGSELKALTRVRSASGVYPAVDALVTLAQDVKEVVGPDCVVTYAADWTEYGAHVADPSANEVRFPLDALWACDAIDAIGIDYYAPLSDWRDGPDHLDRAVADTIYDKSYLANRLQSGEAYDWYYADDAARAAQTRSAITDGLGKPWIYRQKDLWSFWSNAHYERVGSVELASPTAWTPQSKPIWLTELGCSAIDKGANQPSVFPDARSAEAGLPYFSNGKRDDLMQRRHLEAVLGALDPAHGGALNPLSTVYGGRMIDTAAIHLWTWDARPYPIFPAALDTWSDGVNWQTGHWLTGRLGSATLGGLVTALLTDSGVGGAQTSALGDGPDGYVVDRPMPPREMLDPLALAYSFDAREEGGALAFATRGGAPVAEISEEDLVLPEDGAPYRIVRAQDSDLPREVSLGFTDSGGDYQRAAVMSRRLAGGSSRVSHADLAIVTNDSEAERRAEVWLQDLWAGRETVEFALPPSRLTLTPGDVVGVTVGGRRRLFELQEVSDAEARQVRARSIDPEVFDLPLAPPTRRAPETPAALGPVHALVLDLPALANEQPPVLARLAVFADPWPGPVAIWSSSDGQTFAQTALARAPSVIGETLTDLAAGATARFQNAAVDVRLYGGALASVTDATLFSGSNAAAVRDPDGDWEILQFGGAELIGDKTYRLSRLLRGQSGSEWAMADVLPAGSPFVLLDEHPVPIARGLDALGREMRLRIVDAARDHADAAAVALTATPEATALRPLSPVHVRAKRDVSGVTFNWIRRARFDGDTWAVETPLGEDSEQYALDIYSSSDVIRTIESTQPSALYSTADELADFGTPQASLHVQVSQISSTVGRGFAADVTLTL